MNLDAVKTDRIQTHAQHAEMTGTNGKMTQLPRMNNNAGRRVVAKEVVGNSSDVDSTDRAISDIEVISRMMNKKIKFQMDYKNSEMVVRIINKETSELIRQIPAEELRKLHMKLQETAEIMGLIVDEQA